MAKHEEKLADDLLFAPDGHVSDVVLTCLADGEAAVVPQAAIDHVDTCDECTNRLGRAALLSLDMAEALREPVMTMSHVRPAQVAIEPGLHAVFAPKRRPLPGRAIAVALAVAVLAAAPRIIEAGRGPMDLATELLGSIPLFVRMTIMFVSEALERFHPLVVALEWVSAGVLIMAGAALSRSMTRKQSLQGGV